MVDSLNKIIKGYIENENYIIENYTTEEKLSFLDKLNTFDEWDKVENMDKIENRDVLNIFTPQEALEELMKKDVIDSSSVVDDSLLANLDDMGIKQILDEKKLSEESIIRLLIGRFKNSNLKLEYVKKYSNCYRSYNLKYIIKDLESDDDKIDLIEYFNKFELFSLVNDVRKRINAFYKCGFYNKVAEDLEKVNGDDFIIEWLNRIYKNIGNDEIQRLILKIEDENKRTDILIKIKKEIRFFHIYCKTILNTITLEDNLVKFFTENLDSELIESLKNSDLKKMLIEKFGDKLLRENIISIVKTIDDDAYKIKFIEENTELGSYIICGIISSLNDDAKKIELAHYYEDKISIGYIAIILSSMKDDNKKIESIHNFKDLQLDNIDIIIKSIKNQELKLSIIVSEGLSKQNFGWLKEKIEHDDEIINCKTINYALLNWYSSENKINLENLCIFVEKHGYVVLRFIDNVNIKNILNSDKDTFTKFLDLFEQDNLKMNNSIIDSIYDSIMQRIFRNSNIDNVFDLFNIIRDLVYINDKENLLMRLNYLEISGLVTFDMSIEQFALNLLKEDTREEYLNKLKEIVDEYIKKKRNEYVNRRKDNMYGDINTNVKLTKNAFLEEFLNEDVEEILNKLNSIKELLDVSGQNLLSNRDLLIECIKFKKDPKNQEVNFDKIKKHLKTFNDMLDVLEKKTNKVEMNKRFNNIFLKEYEYIPKNIDSELLLKIMSEIDINQLKEFLFTNENLYETLLEILKKYKIIGWGDTFENVLDEAGILYDSSLVAYLISHFYKFYPFLKSKLESGEIKNISFLTLLDEAAVYSSNSNVYKILLDTDDYNLICKNPSPNSSSGTKDERLKKIPKYITTMYERKYITVPPINETIKLDDEKKLDVVIGNVTDTINLTYGERTGACMRIFGVGRTLFDFCLENENGFHVRITDPDTGEFVSRVSGFRNGNTVFLNQLRNSVIPKYSNKDLCWVLKKVSQILIEKTKDSKYPIENVVVSDGYAMTLERSSLINFSDESMKKGFYYFYTDVSSSNAILLASANEDNSMVQVKPGPENAEKYEVLRSKVKFITDKAEITKVINKLLLIKHLLDGKNESHFVVGLANLNIDKLYYGEDWYIALDSNNEIIEEFYIERGDQRVYDEINETKNKILNDQNNNSGGGLKL